jgi:hypothetical protein
VTKFLISCSIPNIFRHFVSPGARLCKYCSHRLTHFAEKDVVLKELLRSSLAFMEDEPYRNKNL